MLFDRSLRLQLSLFWSQESPFELSNSAAIDRLQAAFEPADGQQPMGLHLQNAAHQPGVELVPPATPRVALPAVTWSSGGFWRVSLTPMRLDVFFDPIAFAQARDIDTPREDVFLGDVVARAVPVMTTAVGLWSVSRLALVMRAEANMDVSDAARIVAQRAFSTEIQRGVETGDVADVEFRVNRPTAWTLPGMDESIRVNRLETCSAIWGLAGSQVQSFFRLERDVNTTPQFPGRVPEAASSAFFSQAQEWIMPGLTEVARTGAK